jgi:hypothetical protein
VFDWHIQGGKLGGVWRTTVFVPIDEAILRLKRKPHLNDNGKGDTEASGRYNIERFLSGHIIPVRLPLSPLPLPPPSLIYFFTYARLRTRYRNLVNSPIPLLELPHPQIPARLVPPVFVILLPRLIPLASDLTSLNPTNNPLFYTCVNVLRRYGLVGYRTT